MTRLFPICATAVSALLIVTILTPLRFIMRSDYQYVEIAPPVTSTFDLPQLPISYKRDTSNSNRNGGVSQSSLLKPNSSNEIPLDLYWDDDMPKARICVLPRACVAKDGALILPKWMHTQALLCGVKTIRELKRNHWQPVEKYHADIDLFSHSPVRWHIPHFVTDILAVLYAAEVLRPMYTDRLSKHRHCYNRFGRVICNYLRLRPPPILQAIYADDRIMLMNRTDWVPQLAAMLPERPALFTPARLFASRNIACFRSVVAFNPNSYIRPSPIWYGPKHPMFVNNQLDRESVIRKADSRTGKCNNLQLVILNRMGWKKLKHYQVGRDIVNIDEVVAAVDKAQIGSQRVSINTSVVYFEKMSFRQQVEIMQRADVILGAHGAGLGNLLFARLDTPVVEVLPFGYYPSTFQRLSQGMHLRHETVVGEPETKYFLDCVANRGVALKDPWLKRQGETRWNEAIALWNKGERRVLFAEQFKSENLIPLKWCVRTQRMTVDSKTTAQLVVTLAEQICKKHSDDSDYRQT